MKSLVPVLGGVFSLLIALPAHADKWRMDTDGFLGDKELRNPNVRYYYDQRDYNPAYHPELFGNRYNANYYNNNYYRPNSDWRYRENDWKYNHPCPPREKQVNYYHRPNWRW